MKIGFKNAAVLMLVLGLGVLGCVWTGSAAYAQTDADEAEENVCTDQQGVSYAVDDDHTCYITGCENRKSTIVIPEKITHDSTAYKVKGIAESAFKKCTALKKIEIPNSVTDIAGQVFSGCKNLSVIRVISNKASAKRSGRTAAATVKIDSALLSTAADVRMIVGREAVKEAVKKAVSGKKADAFTLNITVRPNSHYKASDAVPYRIVMQKEAVKAAARSGSFKARVKNAKGSCYYLKISASDLKKASGDMHLALNRQKSASASGTVKKDLKNLLNKNGLKESSVTILNYIFDKASKVNTNFIYPVQGTAGIKAGSSVYVYRYDAAKRKFVSLTHHPYTVSKQGCVSFASARGRYFVASAKQLTQMVSRPKSQFLNESGGTCYVDKNGDLVYGWKKIGSAYYYFDRKSGKMASSRTVDGVPVRKDGTAVHNEAYTAKIQTMMKARAVVEQITNQSDSLSRKLEICFRWIFQFPYRQYRALTHMYQQAGWEVTFANDIFDRHQGCCVSEAAALAFLFHECGCKTVYVCHDTGHAWVEYNGRVYDPLFAEARGFNRYYNVSYQQYGLYAAGRRQI